MQWFRACYRSCCQTLSLCHLARGKKNMQQLQRIQTESDKSCLWLQVTCQHEIRITEGRVLVFWAGRLNQNRTWCCTSCVMATKVVLKNRFQQGISSFSPHSRRQCADQIANKSVYLEHLQHFTPGMNQRSFTCHGFIHDIEFAVRHCKRHTC